MYPLPSSFHEISITPPSPLRAFLFLPGSQRLVGLQAPLALPSLRSKWEQGCSQPPGERVLGTKDLAGCTTGAQLLPEISSAWQPRLEELSYTFTLLKLFTMKNRLMVDSKSALFQRQFPSFSSRMCKTSQNRKDSCSLPACLHSFMLSPVYFPFLLASS